MLRLALCKTKREFDKTYTLKVVSSEKEVDNELRVAPICIRRVSDDGPSFESICIGGKSIEAGKILWLSSMSVLLTLEGGVWNSCYSSHTVLVSSNVTSPVP